MSVHRCVYCRKEFEVLYPDMWAYRQGMTTYFCSWKCLRADEKRGERKMSGAVRKITPEMEKKAAQIAIDGGDPRPYLRDECGSKNPVALWGHIRQKLRDQDPETFAKLPGSLKRKAAPEKAEDAPAEEAKDTPAAEAEKDTGAAAAEDEYTTSAVRHTMLGEFYYDEKHGCMDWRAPDGAEASMAPGAWRKLAREIPVILKRLGVRA